MNKLDRAYHIINHVLALDEKRGRPAPPRTETSDKPSRLIADECRWHATLTREDQEGPDGELWDLMQVYVYDQLRMTAAFRGEAIDLRLFKGGAWEVVFNI